MWQDGGAGAGVNSSAWALPRLSLLLHPEGLGALPRLSLLLHPEGLGAAAGRHEWVGVSSAAPFAAARRWRDGDLERGLARHRRGASCP